MKLKNTNRQQNKLKQEIQILMQINLATLHTITPKKKAQLL